MEVYANIRRKVVVNPLDVIRKLIENSTGYKGWIVEEDGKYYRKWEEHRNFIMEDEITKEKYEYYKALKLVEATLEEKE